MRDPLTIDAGTLRNAIDIQQSTPGGFGAQPTWSTVLRTRAAIRTLTLSERSSASGFTSQATHRITLRYQSAVSITAGMRIVNGAKTYELQAVENVMERNRVITCLALELSPTQ